MCLEINHFKYWLLHKICFMLNHFLHQNNLHFWKCMTYWSGLQQVYTFILGLSFNLTLCMYPSIQNHNHDQVDLFHIHVLLSPSRAWHTFRQTRSSRWLLVVYYGLHAFWECQQIWHDACMYVQNIVAF